MIVYNDTNYVDVYTLFCIGIVPDASAFFKKLPEEVRLKVVNDEIYDVLKKYADLFGTEVVSWVIPVSALEDSEDYDYLTYMDHVDQTYLINKLYTR